MDAAPSGHGHQSIIHGSSAEGGEDDDAERDKLQVLPARIVKTGLSVVVGQGEVLDCVRTETREKSVGECEEHEHIDREPCEASVQ